MDRGEFEEEFPVVEEVCAGCGCASQNGEPCSKTCRDRISIAADRAAENRVIEQGY